MPEDMKAELEKGQRELERIRSRTRELRVQIRETPAQIKARIYQQTRERHDSALQPK